MTEQTTAQQARTWTTQNMIDAYDQGIADTMSAVLKTVRKRAAWLTPELVEVLEMAEAAFEAGIKGRDPADSLSADDALKVAGYPE